MHGAGRPAHASTTDPDARTYRKSHNTASILCYQGHVLMENRSGLVVSAVVTHGDGFGECRAALATLDAVPETGRRSIGADKAYDTTDFVTLLPRAVQRGQTNSGISKPGDLRTRGTFTEYASDCGAHRGVRWWLVGASRFGCRVFREFVPDLGVTLHTVNGADPEQVGMDVGCRAGRCVQPVATFADCGDSSS